MDRVIRQATHDNRGLLSGDSMNFRGLACTGKSSILTNIIAHSILPSTWEFQVGEDTFSLDLEGSGVSVILLDVDLQFSVNRLYSVALHRITSAIEKCGNEIRSKLIGRDEDIQKLILECLGRCHLFKTASIEELSNTMNGLPRWFEKHPDENVQFVIIDSLTSVLWSKQDQIGINHHLYGSQTEKIHNQITKLLKQLQLKWNFVVCTTSRKIAANPVDELPPCWTKFWDFCLDLNRFDTDQTNQLADYHCQLVRSSRSHMPLENSQSHFDFRYTIKDNDIVTFDDL
jgi:hypothetical protein